MRGHDKDGNVMSGFVGPARSSAVLLLLIATRYSFAATLLNQLWDCNVL